MADGDHAEGLAAIGIGPGVAGEVGELQGEERTAVFGVVVELVREADGVFADEVVAGGAGAVDEAGVGVDPEAGAGLDFDAVDVGKCPGGLGEGI